MELHANIKQKLADSVAGKLSAAPDSTAKAELIEELSDNLYHHYQDLTASGLDQEEAYRQVKELGRRKGGDLAAAAREILSGKGREK